MRKARPTTSASATKIGRAERYIRVHTYVFIGPASLRIVHQPVQLGDILLDEIRPSLEVSMETNSQASPRMTSFSTPSMGLYRRIAFIAIYCTLSPCPPSFTQAANSFLFALMSKNPGLSSKAAYGFPPPCPKPFICLASLLRSSLPAHTFHLIGLRSGLLRTTPPHSSKTDTIVSKTMSIGRLIAGSSTLGSIEL